MYLESDKSFGPTPEFLKKKRQGAQIPQFGGVDKGTIPVNIQSIFKVSKARGVVKDWLMCNSNVFSTRDVLWEAFPKVLLSDGVTWLANWVWPLQSKYGHAHLPKLQKRGFVGVFQKCGSQQIAVWAAWEIAGLGLKSARVLCEIFPGGANKPSITGVSIVVKIGKEHFKTKIKENQLMLCSRNFELCQLTRFKVLNICFQFWKRLLALFLWNDTNVARIRREVHLKLFN